MPLAIKAKDTGDAEHIQRLKSLGLTQSDIQVNSSSTLLDLSWCFLFLLAFNRQITLKRLRKTSFQRNSTHR